MNTKITILGATGGVGYNLVKRLYKNFDLACVVRNPGKKDFTGFEKIQVFSVPDIDQHEVLAQAISGSDVVINAGYIWFAEHIHKSLEKCPEKPKQIIFIGSTGIYTSLPSPGAQLKRDAEVFIKQHYTIPWTIIRPTMIYGWPTDKNISKLVKVLSRTPIMPLIGKGDSLIQPVYIEDLINAIEISVLNQSHYNKAFNIGGYKPVTNRYLFTKVSESLGKKTWFLEINPGLMLRLVKILNFFKLNIVSTEQVLRFRENKDIEIETFVGAYDFTPRSFDEGIVLLVKSIRAEN